MGTAVLAQWYFPCSRLWISVASETTFESVLSIRNVHTHILIIRRICTLADFVACMGGDEWGRLMTS